MECQPIDLNSRHPAIRQQDFFLIDQADNREKWDVISLSLVLNFVPEPKDRGEWSPGGRSTQSTQTYWKDACFEWRIPC